MGKCMPLRMNRRECKEPDHAERNRICAVLAVFKVVKESRGIDEAAAGIAADDFGGFASHEGYVEEFSWRCEIFLWPGILAGVGNPGTFRKTALLFSTFAPVKISGFYTKLLISENWHCRFVM